MPEPISFAKALQQIDSIVADLVAVFPLCDPDVQLRLDALYSDLRSALAIARNVYQQGEACAQFLAALEAIPSIAPAVSAQINATKGRVYRGQPTITDPTLLNRLPLRLGDLPPDIAPPVPDLPTPAPARPVLPRPVPPAPGQSFPSRPVSPAPAQPVPPDWSGSSTIVPDPFESMTLPDLMPSPEPDFSSTTISEDVPGSTDFPDAIALDSLVQPTERPPLSRYPEIEYPAQVALGARTSLIVALLREPSAPVSMSLLIADNKPDDQLPEIEVVVRTRGFDIEQSNTQMLAVARDDDVDARFVLTPRQLGAQTIRVDFYQDGRRIGTLRHSATVVERASNVLSVKSKTSTAEVEPLEFAPVGTIAPDLELCVEVDPDDQTRLTFSLHSTIAALNYHHVRMGGVALHGEPLEHMQAIYGELSTLAGSVPATPDEIEYQRRRLERIGNQLWEELFSAELKEAYWQFKDHVKTLLITSDEPWIPWEIVRPVGFDAADMRIDEPHLCERFVVARWLSGNGPASRVPIQRVCPVVPDVVNLASVQPELEYLQRIGQLSAGVVPETPYSERNRVIDLFERGTFSVLHIAAHGSFDAAMPNNSGISLTGGPLRPSDLYARFGGARARPLIFINACHGARAEFAFTGLGGWADRLVRQSRVAAFIGAAWEVNDRLALLFAETFYTALLRERRTIGESFQLAREQIRAAEPSNSTWLAYVLYADPSASVTIAAP